jgi:hypothetical protein
VSEPAKHNPQAQVVLAVSLTTVARAPDGDLVNQSVLGAHQIRPELIAHQLTRRMTMSPRWPSRASGHCQRESNLNPPLTRSDMECR